MVYYAPYANSDESGSNMTVSMYESEFPELWDQIAFIDESESYEVDQTAIYSDKETGTFVFATASGCSCWDGDWDVTTGLSLGEVFDLIGVDGEESGHRWNPSFEGAKSLKAQVEEWNTG